MKRKISNKLVKEAIKESLEKLLTEKSSFVCNIDIHSIPIEELKSIYRDFRLDAIPTCYGDKLYSKCKIKEAYGDFIEPDDAIKRIAKKYDLPPHAYGIKEAYNKVYVYVVTAIIGINDKLIEEDMNSLGYFLGVKGDISVIDGMTFRILQFEPSSQLQKDVTDEVKSENKFLYHWTPRYFLKSALENGLIPIHLNKKYNFPPRVYLIKQNYDDDKLFALGQELSFYNKDSRNNGDYGLIKIDISNIDGSIRFFYDPNSEIGIYTEQPIPSNLLKIERIIKFHTSLR